MAKNRTYRSFVARPSHVLNMDGELLDSESILGHLASEVRDISSYATYVVRNDEALGDELARATAISPADAGRQAGVTMPDFLVSVSLVGRVKRNWSSTTSLQLTALTRSASRPRTGRVLSMFRRAGSAL